MVVVRENRLFGLAFAVTASLLECACMKSLLLEWELVGLCS